MQENISFLWSVNKKHFYFKLNANVKRRSSKYMKDPLCETLCLKILVALYVELNAVEI